MILAARIDGFRGMVPGVVLCGTVAMAASFLTSHYGAPVMLFALLLGMAFNFVDPIGKFEPGVTFASKSLLRVGVALLGARVTLASMMDLGIVPLFLAVSGVMLSMLVGVMLCRAMGKSGLFGVLTGGAVGICGASAALALSSVLPRGPNGISERDTIFTVVAVTALSTVAMVVYPIIAKLLNFDDVQAGIFIGATVHDVAQVVGAGFSISDTAGETSTIVKLMRVAMLVPIIATIAVVVRARYSHTNDANGHAPHFPAFLVGFLALIFCNSFGLIPTEIGIFTADLSRWLLVVAIAALGTKTSLGQLVEVGPTAAVIILAETAVIAILAAVILTWWT